ncbi:MAG TPA: RNA polymerase sigma factor [Vicinamibacterales bacterium]|nr:RNA polymerase sigma factor [Vicinamibacterales bacterium]
MSDDDGALVAAVRDGSELAFNSLVDRHQQAVRAFLRRLLGNEADADDVAQETFVAAWTHVRSFRGGSSVRSWLFGIAWRKAKDAQRSWVRRRSRDTEHYEQRSTETAGATTMEDRLAVRRALQTLPLEQRAAVTLCLVCGFSHAEAAEILAAPLGTVKSHVTRGRERLVKAIERGA